MAKQVDPEGVTMKYRLNVAEFYITEIYNYPYTLEQNTWPMFSVSQTAWLLLKMNRPIDTRAFTSELSNVMPNQLHYSDGKTNKNKCQQCCKQFVKVPFVLLQNLCAFFPVNNCPGRSIWFTSNSNFTPNLNDRHFLHRSFGKIRG